MQFLFFYVQQVSDVFILLKGCSLHVDGTLAGSSSGLGHGGFVGLVETAPLEVLVELRVLEETPIIVEFFLGVHA